MVLSQRRASKGLWVTNKTAVPCSLHTRCNNPNTLSALLLSKLPVGSSAKIKAGFMAKARATATRCC